MPKYVKIDKKLSKLNRLRPFNPMLERLIQDQLMLQWTYNSNAIEGNTLTYKETSFYLLRGLTAKGKSIEEHLEISNHKDAITFLEEIIKEKVFKISEKLIKEVHQILFRGIDQIKVGYPGREQLISIAGGSYKDQDNHVLKAEGTIHYYTLAVAVSAEMGQMIKWANSNFKKIHPIEFAAKIHHEIVKIHPFTDGNGRVARLIMNLILMYNHYPPAIIRNEEKSIYYDALEKADSGDLRPFVRIVQNEVEKTIDLILSTADGKKSDTLNKHVIYKIRKDKKITQKTLSVLSGVEQATISKIENLKENPQNLTLKAISRALGVDIKKLNQ
ncbi:MAG: Fic family protein [Bacteriovoracaceae bacterium]|nr:Fic family protein [Bacteriovoracaceae bacterium]